MVAHELPIEVAESILVRLPVKSLLRFKSICKAWHEVINSKIFIDSHLKRSNETHTNDILVTCQSLASDLIRYYTEVNVPSTVAGENEFRFTHQHKHLCISIDAISSCNGLICLHMSYCTKQKFVVLNPSTREIKKLPYYAPSLTSESLRLVAYGFGHDHVTDEYKVVALMTSYSNYDDVKEINVFSLASGSWTNNVASHPKTYQIKCLYFSDIRISCGAFTNNALHWAKRLDDMSCVIIALHLHTYNIDEISFPWEQNCLLIDISILGGCLCLLVLNIRRQDSFEAWIMKEYKVEESWMKVWTSSSANMFYRPIASYNCNNGESYLLVKKDQTLAYINIDNPSATEAEVRLIGPLFTTLIVASKQSLVPVSGEW